MNNPDRPYLYECTYEQIEAEILQWGEPKFRARQIWNGLYKNYWIYPEHFTNIPITVRERLDREFCLQNLSPSQFQYSQDKLTEKTLFLLADGQALETVLMTSRNKKRPDKKRNTLCVSTQIGCAVGCAFCATGQMGFARNLRCGEIIGQVLWYAYKLKGEGQRIDNIVFMGMGEPFHNYDEIMCAIGRLNDPKGFKFGSRRITISTVGLIPGIARLSKESIQVNLAVSLHAADDALRNQLVPINRKYPIAELMESCLNYVQQSKRRITFEWALIEDINDEPEQAKKLVSLLGGFQSNGSWLCHVNLIPLNPTSQYPGKESSPRRVSEFKRIIDREGITCTTRYRHGIDIKAGCGQLASESDN